MKQIGKYEIIEQIGSGGFGTVYKAQDSIGRIVAIKVLKSGWSEDATVIERFRREALAAGSLFHPRIATILDLDEAEGRLFLVLRYIEGVPLDRMLKEKGAFPWAKAVEILGQVNDGLSYAHAHGFIHRDIKPSNILLDRQEGAVLTDFGLVMAAQSSSLTSSGAMLGTPSYIAPEIWNGEEATPATDVYSLACVFFEMITAKVLFEGKTTPAIMTRHVLGGPVFPERWPAGVPQGVAQVLASALEKDPGRRAQSAGAFFAAITALGGVPAVEDVDMKTAPVEVVVGEEQAEIAPEIDAHSHVVAEEQNLSELETAQEDAGADQRVVNSLPEAPAPPTQDSSTKTLSEAAAPVLEAPRKASSTTEEPAGKHLSKKSRPPSSPKEPGHERRKLPLWIWISGGIGLACLIVVMIAWIVSSGIGMAPAPVAEPQGVVQSYTAADCWGAEVLCVGLITDGGGIDDHSFNESAWNGLNSAREYGYADVVSYIEPASTQDLDANIAAFADTGYDVIVTMGYTMTESTVNAARLYPNMHFIGVDQYQAETIPNLTGLVFPEDQAGFLAGVMAAGMTQSGAIGAVCGTDAVPSVWRYCEGYRAGAKYVNSNVDVQVVYHNEVSYDLAFVDPEWGSETAQAMVASGADVIFGAGGETGNGAVRRAAQQGVYVIGVDTDQYYTLPEASTNMLTSAMKDIPISLRNLIRQASLGSLSGGNYTGTVSYAPYHDTDSYIPEEVKSMMQQTLAQLLAGQLSTNVPAAKP